MHILPIEDGSQLSLAMQSDLEQHDLVVRGAQNATSALIVAEMDRNVCLLLDRNLLEEVSLSILCKLRGPLCFEAILIFTIHEQISDRVLHRGSGVGDSISKSFAWAKLAIRIRSATKLANCLSAEPISYRNIKINVPTLRVERGEENFCLDSKKFSALPLLFKQSRRIRILSRPLVKEALYGWKETIESNQIGVHTHHLQKRVSKRLNGIGPAVADTVDQHPEGVFQ